MSSVGDFPRKKAQNLSSVYMSAYLGFTVSGGNSRPHETGVDLITEQVGDCYFI